MAHLARYWQLTGSELARDTVVKSRPYYEDEPLPNQFFTVEVLPDGCTPADSVRRIATPEGLRGLEVGAGGHWLLLVHNTTDAPITLDTVLPWAEGPLTLHTSGSYEPAGEPLGASDGRVQLDIPAHSHIVVEKHP